MNIKTVESVDEYLIEISKDLVEADEIEVRGLKTKEIEDAVMILLDPSQNIVTLPERKLNLKYLQAELEWYLSGELNPDYVSQFASMWDRIRNPDGTVNSNYGHFVFKQTVDGVNQFNWCLDKLYNDEHTRQAVINYNQLEHKFKGNKDFVCTIAQQFRINDRSLDSRVVMRSNDLIYGFCYDIPWFTYIQQQMADELGISVGKYIHNAMSLHVYERHFNMIENISKREE